MFSRERRRASLRAANLLQPVTPFAPTEQLRDKGTGERYQNATGELGAVALLQVLSMLLTDSLNPEATHR